MTSTPNTSPASERVPATWPADRKLLERVPAGQAAKFIEWMAGLDAEHAKRGRPYGDGSLWKLTGAECWWEFFEDGLSPGDAMSEDAEAWDE